MTMPKKTQRLYFITGMLAVLAVSLALALAALDDNLSLFFAPQQVRAMQAEGAPQVAAGRVFRLGGMVREGSVQKRGSDLGVAFVVTDFAADVPVVYHGILPDLFREGQGVVARGAFDDGGDVFRAVEILAKHDENYMPPEAAAALKKGGGE